MVGPLLMTPLLSLTFWQELTAYCHHFRWSREYVQPCMLFFGLLVSSIVTRFSLG